MVIEIRIVIMENRTNGAGINQIGKDMRELSGVTNILYTRGRWVILGICFF
jgi:hypothetical protein